MSKQLKIAKKGKRKFGFKLSFIILGIATTIWFLIRVIPKPSRAAYPCMRASAPIISSFVLWLFSLGTSALFIKKSSQFFAKANYNFAIVFLLLGLSFGVMALMNNLDTIHANPVFATESDYTPNHPMGEAKGIYPGRVAWSWNPDATNENSSMSVNNDGVIDTNDDIYFVPKNNDEEEIDKMVSDVVLNVTGAIDISAAWDSIFRYHNRRVNGEDMGYSDGETIFIKTNNQGIGISQSMNPDLTQSDSKIWGSFPIFMTATSPYPVLATLKQLVNEAGIPQDKIYVGDPHNNFNSVYYDILSEDFPDVHILGVNENSVSDCEEYGRTLSVKSTDTTVYYSDKGEVLDYPDDKLYKYLQDADYMINIAAMKSHIRGGITLFCKSHFGSHTRSSAAHLHPGLPSPNGGSGNLGYDNYSVLTDIMGHKDLGGKTILYILDALWGGSPHELDEPRKWNMAPFSGDWTSSVFASLDPVAIASVAFDFLRTEYNVNDWGEEAYPNYVGTDAYLHHAADQKKWPENITYDPENDGIPITSLGVHEHWNNAQDMLYSKNIDKNNGRGIELVKLHETSTTIDHSKSTDFTFKTYPNPVKNNLNIAFNSNYTGYLQISICDIKGKNRLTKTYKKSTFQFTTNLSLENIHSGIYFLKLTAGNKTINKKIMMAPKE